jgi:predicted N-acetyltransferase YhbS
MEIQLRHETPEDYRAVETLTREAFWNLFVPGCDEHYLVHVLRDHPDFLPELDLVALVDGRIVGNIMYTRSRLVGAGGTAFATATFGPVSVLPECQGRGIGAALIRRTLEEAASLGFKAVVIEGHPYNYCKHGFKGSWSCGVSDAAGRFPFSLLVRELAAGCLAGGAWRFHPSAVYEIDADAAALFDRSFPEKKKEYRPTQEEFAIASRAFLDPQGDAGSII